MAAEFISFWPEVTPSRTSSQHATLGVGPLYTNGPENVACGRGHFGTQKLLQFLLTEGYNLSLDEIISQLWG